MDGYTATEEAYKNGYAHGVADSKAALDAKQNELDEANKLIKHWMAKANNLRRCPACNAGPEKIDICKVCGSKIFHKYYVECSSCHYCGKTKIFKKRAIRAWNKK